MNQTCNQINLKLQFLILKQQHEPMYWSRVHTYSNQNLNASITLSYHLIHKLYNSFHGFGFAMCQTLYCSLKFAIVLMELRHV